MEVILKLNNSFKIHKKNQSRIIFNIHKKIIIWAIILIPPTMILINFFIFPELLKIIENITENNKIKEASWILIVSIKILSNSIGMLLFYFSTFTLFQNYTLRKAPKEIEDKLFKIKSIKEYNSILTKIKYTAKKEIEKTKKDSKKRVF